MAGGKSAKQTGSAFSDAVRGVLVSHGIDHARNQPAMTSLYGGQMKGHLFLPLHDRILVTRWQGERGTGDEKLPHLVWTIHEVHRYPTVVVIGGDGWRPGALKWLRANLKAPHLVMTFDDFCYWAHRELREVRV